MEIKLHHKIESHRKLCVKKDLIELSQWIDALSFINVEIGCLRQMQKQFLNDFNIDRALLALRRKNTLLMGLLCKYDQELNTEYSFGKNEYNLLRAKEHEKKRDSYSVFVVEFNQFKKLIYKKLCECNSA